MAPQARDHHFPWASHASNPHCLIGQREKRPSSRSLVRTECTTALGTTPSTLRAQYLSKMRHAILAYSCFMPDSRQTFPLETLVTLKNVSVWKNITWPL